LLEKLGKNKYSRWFLNPSSFVSRLNFTHELTGSSASSNGNNLFDKKHYDNLGFYNSVYWRDPRTVTLSLDWSLQATLIPI